jgi:hypothetical protein
MIKFSPIALAVLISFGIASAGLAADTKDKSAAPSTTTTKAPSEQRFRGSVSALDTKAGTVKIKGRNDEKSFTIGDKAKSSFAKVKVGDRVRVAYADEGGKLVVHSLSDSKSGSDSKASK